MFERVFFVPDLQNTISDILLTRGRHSAVWKTEFGLKKEEHSAEYTHVRRPSNMPQTDI